MGSWREKKRKLRVLEEKKKKKVWCHQRNVFPAAQETVGRELCFMIGAGVRNLVLQPAKLQQCYWSRV